MNQAENLMRCQFFAAFEKRQFHKEGTARDAAARFFDQTAARQHRAAGRQEVIHEQHAGAGSHAVDMDLQLGAAVLQVVLKGMRAVRELARFAERDERPFQQQSQRSRKQEPPGFGSRHRIDLLALVMFLHALDRLAKGFRLSQERGNVLEKDARFGKIRDIANVLREVHHNVPLATALVVKGYGFIQEQATMPLTIRPATPADASTIVEFNRCLAEESEGKILDLGIVTAGVAAALADPERKGPYFLAAEGDAVLGQMQITYEWSDWRNGWAWWIQGVYVRPENRRRGIFRALYEHVYRLAKQDSEVIALRLYVDRNNSAAQQTYLGMGMELMNYLLLEKYPL
jgi:GNAT superfamily N-acetyltransferase